MTEQERSKAISEINELLSSCTDKGIILALETARILNKMENKSISYNESGKPQTFAVLRGGITV